MAKQLGGGTPQPKWTQGPLHSVPCPNCGRTNDFRHLEQQQLLDTGHKILCGLDNDSSRPGCGQSMEVVRVATIKMVAVRPNRGGTVSRNEAPAHEATTISPAQLQRLLR